MRNKIIRILTVVIVFILIANPEYFLLGLFIDSVGLEILFMLMGIQILSISKDYYDSAKRSVIMPMKLLYVKICVKTYVTTKTRAITTFTTSVESILMIVLVFGAAIDVSVSLLAGNPPWL